MGERGADLRAPAPADGADGVDTTPSRCSEPQATVQAVAVAQQAAAAVVMVTTATGAAAEAASLIADFARTQLSGAILNEYGDEDEVLTHEQGTQDCT